MDWHDLREFISDLQSLRDFFFEIVANQEYLAEKGLKVATNFDGYDEAIDTLASIEARMLQCERLAKFIDVDLADRIGKINRESPLIERAGELKLAFKLATSRRYRSTVLNLIDVTRRFVPVLGFERRLKGVFFGSEEVPIMRMLSDLERTLPYLSQMETLFFRRGFSDEEVFKPSNVNVVDVRVFVDKAMKSISSSTEIDEKTRVRLEEYLVEVKAELAKDSPAWKKIVGALVIVAAILGGIADSSDALSNVNSAVRYILGTSIETVVPKPTFGPPILPPTVET